MRLKKIKLAGFKSFVDPTTIEFPSQLVGVVGPNGCGKSNVIDAVRWVMGESSARHLRGGTLEDVIFTGSAERKPVGRATVELVFDNRDGSLGGQYASYSEISIRRQLSRDGQSVYYLNGARCRRRDITDIFLGTGLGPRSYAIIEQGTISRIIEARPEELRVFLEEAAGVSKYKDRRKETEARIRDTRDNIARLDDLIGEIDKRIQTLQRQARAAERYRDLREQSRRCKAEWLALRWRSLDRQVEGEAARVHGLELRREQCLAELRALEAEAEHLRQQVHEASEALATAQGTFYSSGADVARAEQLIKHHEERLIGWRRDLEQAERDHELARRDSEGDACLRRELEADIAAAGPRLEQARAEESKHEQAVQAAEQTLQDWQQRWDELNDDLARHRQQAEVEAMHMQHEEAQLAQVERRRSVLESEMAELLERRSESANAGLVEQCRELEQRRQSLALSIEIQLRTLAKQRDENRELAAKRSLLDERRHELHREQATLQALQKAALDKQEGAVGDWLAGLELAPGPTLAEVIEVEPGWERAVECVLGRDLEAIATMGLATPVRHAMELPAGRITLVDQSERNGDPATAEATLPGLRPLNEFVHAPWPIESLLAGVHVSLDVDEALSHRADMTPGQSIVTRDGVWIGSNWMRLERGAEEGGVLMREQRLRQLADEITAVETELAEVDAAWHAGDRVLGEMGQRRDEQQRELHALTREESALQGQLARQQVNLERALERERAIREELEELEQRREEATRQLARARSAREAAEAHIEARGQLRQAYEEERRLCRETADSRRADLRACQMRLREALTRIETARTRLQALDEAQQRSAQRQQQVIERRQALLESIEQAKGPGEALAQDLQAHLKRRAEAQKGLDAARQCLEGREHALREIMERQREAERHHEALREELDALRLSLQEAEVRRQTIAEQLNELGSEPGPVLATLVEDASEETWQQRLADLEGRIQRLGPINLAAIEEFEQESERRRYLDEQARDLNEALATLQRAIEKIDNETKNRFRETFDQVNERLADLYPRLFGGGMARLEMTSDDLLESGISVVARPPGKRNSSIQQLSGGEKALTASALVFALFELNPAPFCMLDEVDAPLDDSNAARFCHLVEAMSERVQFIYITHNKIAMEMAHQLLGVTMYEPGVSRIVAVDVAEAGALAETA